MTRRRPTPIEHALLAFGISNAQLRRQPSFSSVVHRITVDDRQLFLKEHAPEAAARIELAATLSDRLALQGLPSSRFVATNTGERYARSAETLFTLSERAGDRPLSVLDLADHESARHLGGYLARLHAVFNNAPGLDPPPRQSLWRDSDRHARVARAREALDDLDPNSVRRTMLDALAAIERTPAAQVSLLTLAERTGIVHGDFWPGNLVVREPPLSTPAVIDLESACRAPLLLDVAHFADLGFRALTGWRKTREMDLVLATTFAGAYAAASSMPVEELRSLPDLVVAARGCSILWLVERHLDIGPSATDQLVQNDLCTIQFVTRIAHQWSDDLSATPRSAAMLGSR
jgi:Ser/Thr protein kinase RdoA (MazF antagonist)